MPIEGRSSTDTTCGIQFFLVASAITNLSAPATTKKAENRMLKNLLTLATLLAATSCAATHPNTRASVPVNTRTSVPVTANASAPVQDAQHVRYGTIEGESILTFGGSLSNQDFDSGGDTKNLTAQVGYGRFLANDREVGGQALISESDDFTFINLAPYYNWNWKHSERTWYYAGPHAGLGIIEGPGFDDTVFSVGVHAGLRQWVTPRTSYFIEPRITTSSDLDEFAILFGINVSLD